MKTWDITKTQYKVSDFISWQRSNSLILSPTFQRRSVWRSGAKSYLIDTIIRGLPIPIIFLRDRKASIKNLQTIREVVDGQQRLRTVISFIEASLLEDFDDQRDLFRLSKVHNKDYGNLTFRELPENIIQRILDYEFSVHILPSSTEDREVLQIFSRMNSTGTRLNNQELRNAEFFGEFKTSVYELALEYLNHWRIWNVFTDDEVSRMKEVELSSELYMLIIGGVQPKTPKVIENYYKEYDEDFSDRKIVEKRFEAVMDEIEAKFVDYIPESLFKNSTLFYVLFAIVYEIGYGIDSSLVSKRFKKLSSSQIELIKKKEININAGKASEKIIEAASTRRATNITQRKLLIDYFLKGLK